ncbi:MAG TPA: ADP-ribose pyrophosphatase, partial [Dehalococcoidia bacterium]
MSEDREPAAERVTESRRVFEGTICALRVDTVALPGGGTATREIVEHDPVAAIVPVEADGTIVLI